MRHLSPGGIVEGARVSVQRSGQRASVGVPFRRAGLRRRPRLAASLRRQPQTGAGETRRGETAPGETAGGEEG